MSMHEALQENKPLLINDALLREVETFILDEADLLDSWELERWQDLFTGDGRYLIPPLNVENPETIQQGHVVFLAHDDIRMIKGRVQRLLKKSAYAESPRSNVRHMITNVRLISEEGPEVRARATFMVYRSRRGIVTQYVGRYFYTLVREGDAFRIREKRACLDNDLLQPQGSIGIIL